MRLVIICGSLEPGKCGVGDYTRTLASELVALGHNLCLIALYDPFVRNVVRSIPQDQVRQLRIGEEGVFWDRLRHVRAEIEDFDPSWISLQYVAYSYHPKGLNMIFPFLMERLKGRYNWHLMIHEPWLRGNGKYGKSSLVGGIQKQLLKLLVEKISPRLIHTSNKYYQEFIRQGGLRSNLLKLPGNIPVTDLKLFEIQKEFSSLGISKERREEWVVLGIFGSMRREMRYQTLLEEILSRPEYVEKKVAFLSIGKAGGAGEDIMKHIRENYNGRILTAILGERSPAEVSAFLHLLDYGVASVPLHLLGKSGSYAAMRNHGVQVLVPKTQFCPDISQEQVALCSEYLLKAPNQDFSPSSVADNMLAALRAVDRKQMLTSR